MKKMIKVIKFVFLFILIFFLTLAVFSTKWALNTFAFLNFDEILFQLTSPLEGTSTEMLNSFYNDSLFTSFFFSILIFLVLCLIIGFLSCKKIKIELSFFKKNYNFDIKCITLKILLGLGVFVASVVIVYECLDKVTFIDFVKTQLTDSSFIEDNYVDPRNVSLEFPENKRNLIYIYAESLESTFFTTDLGGVSSENYLEPLVELTSNNINFSDGSMFGGASQVKGTTWTSAAMVSHTSGLPLKMDPVLINDKGFSSILNAYTLGDILKDNNYNQMFMFGSDKSFGNRGAYLEKHGYEVYDYYTAIEKGKIDEDYYVWWGFEDSKLFEFAKDEILNLAEQDKPFNFSLLTVNTHAVDGYLEEDCNANFSRSYGNSIYCSASQIADFIHWIQEQDFYENTSVVLVGDHISMQEGLYPEDVNRKVYNLFLNSSITEGDFLNRQFTTMDFFPTTLASMGVTIEGNRLGLGTNLFSDKKTLAEEKGFDFFEKEIEKYSTFYMKNFIY